MLNEKEVSFILLNLMINLILMHGSAAGTKLLNASNAGNNVVEATFIASMRFGIKLSPSAEMTSLMTP